MNSPAFLNSLKAAVATAFFTFVATAGSAVVGLLDSVSAWAAGGEAPDFSTTRQVVVSAFIAGISGLVNWLVRYVQQSQNPEAGPQYVSTK